MYSQSIGLLVLLLSSFWVSRTRSTSDWSALQEALYKCIDTMQYNTIAVLPIAQTRGIEISNKDAMEGILTADVYADS